MSTKQTADASGAAHVDMAVGCILQRPNWVRILLCRLGMNTSSPALLLVFIWRTREDASENRVRPTYSYHSEVSYDAKSLAIFEGRETI